MYCQQADTAKQAPEGILTRPGDQANCHQMLHAAEDAVKYKVPLHTKHRAVGMITGEVGGMEVVISPLRRAQSSAYASKHQTGAV